MYYGNGWFKKKQFFRWKSLTDQEVHAVPGTFFAVTQSMGEKLSISILRRSQALDISFVDCLANYKNCLQFYPFEIQLKRELKLSVSHSTVFC